MDQLDARSDIFGMRINANGTIVDPKGFVFSNSPLAETAPNVASAGGGVSLMAASLMRNEAPLVNYRIGYEQLGVGGNRWPVAVAAGSPASGDVPLSVTFSSAGSSDPDGSIASYLWEFGDGATSTAANPSHTYTVPGQYVALLTVTDNQGTSTRNTVQIDATAPNQLPVAVASANTYGGPAPLDVTFYARGSYDPDGSIGNVQWDFGDGNIYWGATNYNTFQQPGVYNVVGDRLGQPRRHRHGPPDDHRHERRPAGAWRSERRRPRDRRRPQPGRQRLEQPARRPHLGSTTGPQQRPPHRHRRGAVGGGALGRTTRTSHHATSEVFCDLRGLRCLDGQHKTARQGAPDHLAGQF